MENVIEYSNIKELIINKVKENGEKILYVKKVLKDKKETYENISYKKFFEDVNAFGASLYNLNLKNERIAIVGRNRYEWAMAHVTNLLGGIVSVPLDKELKIEELENSIKRSKVKAIVFDEKYVSLMEEIKNRNNTFIKEYICMSECEGYKDVNKLKRYVSERGKILPRRITGNCAKHQRALTVAVKRARHIALMPYTME